MNVLKKHKNPVLEARIYCGLGEIYFKLADVAQAESAIRQGIELATKINDDASLWRDYTIQAKLEFTQGQEGTAKESRVSALSYLRSPESGLFPTPERLGFPTTREDLASELIQLAAQHGMVEQALLAAEQLKDESFSLELFSHCDLVKPEDRDVYNDSVTQRVHLHAVEASQDSPSTMVERVQVWLRRFRTVVVQNRQLARMIAPVAMHMQDMIKALQGNKSTFVEYSIGPESSTVFIVDSDGRISSEILPVKEGKFTISNIGNFKFVKELIGKHECLPRSPDLSNLYNQLLPPPVRALIPNNPDRTLVIIPDGVLFNLPFAALIGEDGKFLIENHTLTMACSMGAFIDTPSQYSNDNSIVVAADGLGAGDNVISSGVFQPELITKLSGEQDSVSDLLQ